MTFTDEELAYIAGFFDGEGSVTIHENCKPSPRGKSPNHTLQVSIGNTDPSILVWIQKEFGGSLTNRPAPNERSKAVTQWTVRARSAFPFLLAIEPFVRMKKPQIQKAIEFQSSKSMVGPKRVSSEVLVWREAQRQIIRKLNGRHRA